MCVLRFQHSEDKLTTSKSVQRNGAVYLPSLNTTDFRVSLLNQEQKMIGKRVIKEPLTASYIRGILRMTGYTAKVLGEYT
jgi:hypothetical protein